MDDNDGGAGIARTNAISVANVSPVATITGVPTSTISEGGTIGLVVHPSDAGADATFSYNWSVQSNGQAYTLPTGSITTGRAFTFVPRNDGAYIATCVVTDDAGATVSESTGSLTVANAAPTGTVHGIPSNSVAEGAAISLTATATDAGSDDTLSYSLN